MRHNLILVVTMISLLSFSTAYKAKGQSMEVKQAVAFDVSKPLREMQPAVVSPHFWDKWKTGEKEHEVPNKFRPVSPEVVPDAAVQKTYNNGPKAPMSSPIQNFAGLTNGSNTGGRVTPPDPAGDVGPNHYVQVVNSMLQVFSKTGTSLYGPVTTSTLWSGFTGNWTGHNDGDAVVLYDENADRWLVAQFAVDCGTSPNYTEYQMVAISTTPDPTGSWYRYAFQFDYFPDYPKMGVWPDGYYLAVNRFNSNNANEPYIGAGAGVLDRTKMLAGDPSASMIYFKTETLGGSGSAAGSSCWAMLPSDCDGTFPATGTPNYFAYIPSTSASQLRLWALHVDWTTPSSSTFTYVTSFAVTAYTALSSVSQKGTTNKLDGLGDRLMYRNQYRNFGTYESFVTCHNVSVSSTAAIRWYEYRKTGSTFTLYQQSTYAPGDGLGRWMASIAQNANGDIGMAYSASSSTTYPSIYYTGRKSTDALNTMTVAEGTIQVGTASITGATRWGDYTAVNVDPTDNTTFWTDEEYVGTYGGTWPWATKIASFKFSSPPIVTTTAANALTTTTATLNGTVNPNGLATTYHFEWGLTTSYGTSTTATSAGSGTSAVAESAGLTGLTAGSTYHFRLVGVNSDGTTNGSDMQFTTTSILAPTVTTTTPGTITLTTASSGGNVTADGGGSVTARGVCWSTAASPTVASSHTTDGTGTGTFTSSITGLTSNTPYHVRAYATNSAGTGYGSDLQFTTLAPTLSVTPSNQNVAASAGSTTFTVTSNTSWTAVSNQTWCTVTSSGSGNGTITANYTINTASSRTANITVTVSGLTPVVVTVTQAATPNTNVTLTLFLEGLYAGNGTMNQAQDQNGPHWPSPIADKITVELHNNANYENLMYTVSDVSLNTSGIATFTVPYSYSDSYYITIIHRNSILTVSSSPVSFASGTVNYNFTDQASKAYGSNQAQMIDNKWVFFAGDVNQDGIVDSGDYTELDNDASSFVTGYVSPDVNGDGTVDSGDMSMLDNNATIFVSAISP